MFCLHGILCIVNQGMDSVELARLRADFWSENVDCMVCNYQKLKRHLVVILSFKSLIYFSCLIMCNQLDISSTTPLSYLQLAAAPSVLNASQTNQKVRSVSIDQSHLLVPATHAVPIEGVKRTLTRSGASVEKAGVPGRLANESALSPHASLKHTAIKQIRSPALSHATLPFPIVSDNNVRHQQPLKDVYVNHSSVIVKVPAKPIQSIQSSAKTVPAARIPVERVSRFCSIVDGVDKIDDVEKQNSKIILPDGEAPVSIVDNPGHVESDEESDEYLVKQFRAALKKRRVCELHGYENYITVLPLKVLYLF